MSNRNDDGDHAVTIARVRNAATAANYSGIFIVACSSLRFAKI